MAWIESHQELSGHPKKDRLCELLFGETVVPDDVADSAAIGILHRLWWWAVDYAPDGSLVKFTDRQIARGCRWNGDPKHFVASLIEAGFIDADRRLHDWDEYGGRLLEQRERYRAANAERQRRYRARHSTDTQSTVTRDITGDMTPCNGPTNITVLKEKVDVVPNGPTSTKEKAPAGSDDFGAFWSAYPKCRRVDKGRANRAWNARTKAGSLAADMVSAAKHYAAYHSAAQTDPKFIKHPSTFIGPDKPFEEWVGGVPDAYRASGSRDLSADDLFAMAAMAEAEDVPDSDCEVIP